MRWLGQNLVASDSPRKGGNVRICAFRIVDDFLLFSLHRTDEDVLEFPIGSFENAEDLIGKEHSPHYTGSMFYKGSTYLWYECSSNVGGEAAASFMNRTATKWWVLSSEIVNWRKVLHFPVAESVVYFFLAHSDLLFVETDEGQRCDCPMVGYYGAYYTKILKLAIIGAPRSEWEFASLGPYFYFGDYMSGMRYAVSPMSVEREMFHAGEKIVRDDGTYIRGGIARFALRTGADHTMMLGKVRDRSKRTRKGVREGTVRSEDAGFRDADGKWAETFDAVLLGRRSVRSRSSGEMKVLNPQYVMKHFEQHIPLSYHYVDTTSQTAETGTIE